MNSDLIAGTRTAGKNLPALAAEFAVIEQLFDHLPETAFFLKNSRGQYLAVNQSLVERCGFKEKRQLLGRHVSEIFPKGMAELFASQDQAVLRTGRPVIDHLELHWYARRQPGWCLTTKLPMHNGTGAVIGLVGISRDLRAPGAAKNIPSSLVSALEHLESHCDQRLSPASLARLAGLSPVRFARLVKRIFGRTPGQLIVLTRLAAAARMLAETDRSMADIAYACGFYDHSAMTRAFRSATSLTPTQYRRSVLRGRP